MIVDRLAGARARARTVTVRGGSNPCGDRQDGTEPHACDVGRARAGVTTGSGSCPPVGLETEPPASTMTGLGAADALIDDRLC